MSQKKFHREPVKMVPAPSYGILPERDVLSRPVLETRNLGIYLHWGYDRLLCWEVEEDTLVLYYEKTL